ncbi:MULTISPECIES: 3-hydroxyacyl-CoA dehydrogenase family protein [unclassified Leifsonia]|uniref:3-hydroxyacyl-CoA dehydrogenase family protein n=1 Tax=unclassified Leifsonia TaxID=2663824 RepID=UPI0006F1EB46|nr:MULTISPECIES: 3-hydroxyacyl-CoA dehydrogenase family protein [unclassified Leifsonia]KQX05050.1 3-hydroxybutyryl-CoA dehydrogenase [Leifsonia sp. Root1293]KRA08682.1 3-hydroxybutyryl-CoA dehydrogenase [Leifsonia sp. Root60]
MTATDLPGVVGVLGGGRMGSGIAHAFVLAGCRVIVVERDSAAADAASASIRSSLDASVARGSTTSPLTELVAAVRTTTDVAAFADAGLVIEAVPEDFDVKRSALRRVEAVVAPGAAIATNTSSMSIDALADELARPARFIGLHFFNPVPASKLVEIVVGTATDDALVARAAAWVGALGKTAVTVRDAPGFASSRLGVALGLEAIRLLEDGVASAADIDAAMTLGYRHPVGPLETTDIVGLDVRLGIAEYLHRQLGPRFEPPQLLRRLVAEGKLGRKTGQGFYVWTDGQKEIR